MYLKQLIAGTSLVVIATANLVAAELNVEVSLDQFAKPSKLSASFSTNIDVGRTCFYLAYNDPDFRTLNKMQQRIEAVPLRGTPLATRGGALNIISSGIDLERISGSLIAVNSESPRKLDIVFQANIPRFATDRDEQWFYYEYYPRQLKKCPDPLQDVVDYKFSDNQDFNLTVNAPDDWTIAAANAEPSKNNLRTSIKREAAFALVKTKHTTRSQIGSLKLHLLFDSDEFLRLLPTMIDALGQLNEWVGPLPLSDLVIVEAKQYERDQIPGLVLINKPQHAGLESFQNDWMNWGHWATVMLLCRQWYGARLRSDSMNDEWLARGTAEFLTLIVLKNYETRYDLFNLFDGAYSLLDMNYRELHDIGAMIMFQNDPHALLTKNDMVTSSGYREQHPMLPLRHAIALRYINGIVGESRFRDLFLKMTKLLDQEPSIDPSIFMTAFTNANAAILSTDEHVDADLLKWWTTATWPDFWVDSYDWSKREDGTWNAKIIARDYSGLVDKLSFTVTDTNGEKKSSRFTNVKNKPGYYFGDIVVDQMPDKIVIDEDRKVFDSDRYNNTTAFAPVRFFPGNARGIPDDAYTLVWFPYPFRRPGQEWSLALRMGLFQYINSATTMNIEYEMSDRRRSAFEFNQVLRIPDYKLNAQISAKQNFYGSRIVEIGDTIGPLFDWHQHVGVGLALRWRQIVGVEDSRHGTVALNYLMQPRGERKFYSYLLQGEHEHAPKTKSINFHYDRAFATLKLNFFARHYFDYSLRLFRGELWSEGEVDGEYLFRPQDLLESHIRLEVADIARTRSLYSINNDIFLPAIFPLEDLALLSTSKLKWRLFYDYGRDLDNGANLAGSGVGIDAPLGGDVTGVGKLAVTQLSLLAIIHSRNNDKISNRTKILFSLGADL